MLNKDDGSSSSTNMMDYDEKNNDVWSLVVLAASDDEEVVPPPPAATATATATADRKPVNKTNEQSNSANHGTKISDDESSIQSKECHNLSEAQPIENERRNLRLPLLQDTAARAGILILEGQDNDDNDDDDGSSSKQSSKSSSAKERHDDDDDDDDAVVQVQELLHLSIPETIFLPSEIASLEGSKLLLHDSRELLLNGDGDGDGNAEKKESKHTKVSTSTLIATAMILSLLAILLSFTTWKCISLRHELHRRNENLQRERSLTLMPMIAVLSLSRERLLVFKNKISLLEKDIDTLRSSSSSSSSSSQSTGFNNENERRRGNGNYSDYYQDIFSGEGEEEEDQENDETGMLLINNCYVQASLSLGSCSREWQTWWNNSSSSSSSSRESYASSSNGDKTATNTTNNEQQESAKDFPYQVGDVLSDVSQFVQGFVNSIMTETLSFETYSFVENNVKNMSYSGVDGILFLNDSIQMLKNITSEAVLSNSATNYLSRYLNLSNTSGSTATAKNINNAISHFVGIAQGAIDEGTKFTRNVEKSSYISSLSRAFEYTSSWLKNASTRLSEDYSLLHPDEE